MASNTTQTLTLAPHEDSTSRIVVLETRGISFPIRLKMPATPASTVDAEGKTPSGRSKSPPKLGNFSRIFELGLLPRIQSDVIEAAPIRRRTSPRRRSRSPVRSRSPLRGIGGNIQPLLDSLLKKHNEQKRNHFNDDIQPLLDSLEKKHNEQNPHHPYDPDSPTILFGGTPRDSTPSDIGTAGGSTPATTPPSSHGLYIPGKRFGPDRPTGFPTDVFTNCQPSQLANWQAWKRLHPGYHQQFFKSVDLQQLEYVRIARLQERMQYLDQGKFSFSVPWSVDPNYLQNVPHWYLRNIPWWENIVACVGPRPMSGDAIEPLYQVHKATQLAILKAELHDEYAKDIRLRDEQAQVFDFAPHAPIHVFVDLSNITIGYYDCLKEKRAIGRSRRVKASPFFFEALAEVLERGRPTAKKVCAGSRKHTEPLLGHMLEADLLGYEMHILTRVLKPRHNNQKNHGNKSDGTSGADSSEDARSSLYRALKHGEQGVDELLHLKMGQSILDAKQPGVMVIATGDAAEAEYSDGFLKNAERALARGWHVELVAWRKNISSAWRNPQFLQAWGDRFRIIELDPVVEELLGFYTR